MPDLAALTIEFFDARVGTTFTVADDAGERVELRVIDALPWGEHPPDAGRRPFTVHFLGPARPLLPQKIYVLEHGEAETLELFLVPLGPHEDGIRYEAVFS
jgi:hypothetical protein